MEAKVKDMLNDDDDDKKKESKDETKPTDGESSEIHIRKLHTKHESVDFSHTWAGSCLAFPLVASAMRQATHGGNHACLPLLMPDLVWNTR